MAEEWRDWRLIWYSGDHFRRRPNENPPKSAEISADRAWATIYADDRVTAIAVWIRYRMPTRETLARATAARRDREAVRVDDRSRIV